MYNYNSHGKCIFQYVLEKIKVILKNGLDTPPLPYKI